MAFPTSSSPLIQKFASSTKTFNIAMPTAVAAGNLLEVIFYLANGEDSFSWSTIPEGWTLQAISGTVSLFSDRAHISVFSKVADGSEAETTVQWVNSVIGNQFGNVEVYQTWNWDGNDDANGYAASATGSGGSISTPNTPNLAPVWGAADTLWRTCISTRGSITAAPTNYSNEHIEDNPSSHNSGSATRELNASSENPGAWNAATARWHGATIGIRPGTAGSQPSGPPDDPVTPDVVSIPLVVPVPALTYPRTYSPDPVTVPLVIPTPTVKQAQPQDQRVWAVIYDTDGSTQLGAALTVLDPLTRRGVNRIGQWSFALPATDPAAAQLQISGYAALYYGLSSNNPRMVGRIDAIEHRIDERDEHLVVASGYSLAIELQDASTYSGIIADDDSVQDADDALLSGTGWTDKVTGSGFQTLTQRFTNMSVWQALTWIADQQGAYLRETNTERQVEIKRGNTASGLTSRNAPPLSLDATPDSTIGWVRRIGGVRQDGTKIKNRIVPQGKNAGNIVFDIRHSDRSSPYTIQTFTPRAPTITAEEFFDFSDNNPVGEPGEIRRTALGEINVVGPNRGVLIVSHTHGDAPPPNPSLVSLHFFVNGEPFLITVEDQFPIPNANQSVEVNWIPVTREGTAVVEASYFIGEGETVNANIWAYALQDVDPISTQVPSQILTERIRGSGTAASVTLEGQSNELRIGVLAAQNSLTSVTSGADQTRLDDVLPGSATNPATAIDRHDEPTDDTFSWTINSSQWAAVAILLPGAQMYYIEDTTSVNTHGGPNSIPRALYLIEPASKFVGATDEQLTNAANTLYDAAASLLDRLKDPPSFYEDIELVNDLDDSFLPGDTIDLKGVFAVEDLDGTQRAWLTIDDTLIVTEVEERWDRDAVRHWRLKLATTIQGVDDDLAVIAEMKREIRAIESTLT